MRFLWARRRGHDKIFIVYERKRDRKGENKMFGIQKTIAICYELHDDFKGDMLSSTEYANYSYIEKKHKHIFGLYRLFYPEIFRRK